MRSLKTDGLFVALFIPLARRQRQTSNHLTDMEPPGVQSMVEITSSMGLAAEVFSTK